MLIHDTLIHYFAKADPVLTQVIQKTKFKFEFLTFTVENKKVKFSAIPVTTPLDYRCNFTGTQWWSLDYKSRQPVKLAAMLLKQFPDRLNENSARKFVESVTSAILTKNEVTVKLVEGEELRNAYLYTNYESVGSGSNLFSCMSHAHQQMNLDFYVYNPETIKCLVLYNNYNQIVARSLIFIGTNNLTLLNNKDSHVKILGRLYGNSFEHRLQLLEEGKNYADYYCNNGQSQSLKPLSAFTNKVWYIPLQHAALNYYPWTDNGFRNVILNDKLGNYLTNGTVPAKSKYIEALHGGMCASWKLDEPFLDPHRPDKIWNPDTGRWITNDGSLVWIGDCWISKSKAKMCSLCNHFFDQKESRKLVSGGNACTAHVLFPCDTKLFLTKEEIRGVCDCGRGFYTRKGDKWCSACLQNLHNCVECNETVRDIDRIYNSNKEAIYLCKPCLKVKNLKCCFRCNTYSTDTKCIRCFPSNEREIEQDLTNVTMAANPLKFKDAVIAFTRSE